MSGTGAMRIAGEVLKKLLDPPHFYICDPTWGNHHRIFGKCGYDIRTYPY